MNHYQPLSLDEVRHLSCMQAGAPAAGVGMTNAQRLDRIAHLRTRIAALDPDAALYYGWGGPADRDNDPKRRKGDEEL